MLVRVHWVVAAVVLTAATACGGGGVNQAQPPSQTPANKLSSSTPQDVVDNARPPDVVVHTDGRALTISAHSFCYANVCADGTVPPPPGPPDVGASAELLVEFPIASWSFEARFVEAGTEHGREQTVPLEPQSNGRWRLGPAGVAGTYDIWLWGRADGGGDAGYVFRWTTTADGAYAAPVAYTGILVDDDGHVESHGVELSITGLAQTPATAIAKFTVVSSNGKRMTFYARRVRRPGPEGFVRFRGLKEPRAGTTQLGPPPFTYKVLLTLDGIRYVATATWPRDEIRGSEPYVALKFNPPLPGLS